MPCARTLLACPVLSILLLGACQVPPGANDFHFDDDEEASTGGDDSGPPTTGDAPPVEPMFDCEPADPKTCPTGQKCTAVSDGGLQNHFECVPDDGILLPYDPCVPAPGNGQDACGAGTVCLSHDEEDLGSGRCYPGCRYDADCEPGLCVTSPFSGTNFCADNCDPIVAFCPAGLGCRQAEDRFVCEMRLATDIGLAGEPCYGLRGCADAYACLPGELVPNCNSGTGFCCTNTCTTDGPNEQCTSPALCTELFTDPAPEFELIGACFFPA